MKTENGETGHAVPGIRELFQPEKLEEIQDKIGKATGLAFVTVDYTGSPITKLSCFTEFCQNLRNRERSCEICRKSDAFGALQAAVSHRPCTYFCPCGLLEVAIPIEKDGAFLGGFIGGQVRCKDAPEDTTQLSRLFRQNPEDFETETMQELKSHIKEYSYSQYMDVVNLVQLIVREFHENGDGSPGENPQVREEIRELSEERDSLKLRSGILEQKLLDFQMNRNEHFFANVLTSISNLLVLEETGKAEELLITLAEYLREGSRAADGYWSILDEAEQIRRYIRLTCTRYGDRFTCQLHLSDRLKGRRIPVHLILPFVQDAVYYGIALKKDETQLTISINPDGDDAVVDITENGPGLSKDELRDMFRDYEGKHEGEYIDALLFRTIKRIREEYGEAYSPKISVEPGIGRRFCIRIPSVIGKG